MSIKQDGSISHCRTPESSRWCPFVSEKNRYFDILTEFGRTIKQNLNSVCISRQLTQWTSLTSDRGVLSTDYFLISNSRKDAGDADTEC